MSADEALAAMTAERDALRTRLALHEAFVSALDAHEEAVHALECATPSDFAALYDARAAAWERAHAAREALREAAPRADDWHLEPDEMAF